MSEQKSNKRLVQRLKKNYRLVIINDETFEERFSIKLSPINVVSWGGFIVMVFVVIIYSAIAYTPLREFIPGYADVSTRRNASYAAFKTDSLEKVLGQNINYLNNIRLILSGRLPDSVLVEEEDNTESMNINEIKYTVSKEDSNLRKLVEQEERFSLATREMRRNVGGLSGLFFFNPVNGKVSDFFNAEKKHFGVDIVTKKNEVVLSVLDGTVTLATWTSETGNVIQVQHANDLISVYKHNSVLLKKAGDLVKAGEAIAVVGNSGKFTTGPHLHFELWHNGQPINPENYIIF